jgi:LAO/AO transport system kinase
MGFGSLGSSLGSIVDHDMIADVSIEANAVGWWDVARVMERLRAGNVRTLARMVSVMEDGGVQAVELLEACRPFAGSSLRIGVTGPPGAGKSTLVDQMVRWLRAEGQSVGVVAVDPSSPYTGGALLGDRIRMQNFAGDAGVYIRSMASRGAVGGIAKAAANVCSVIEAAGRDIILIETVGVGQGEVDVVGLADVTVVVLVPGMGDEIQSLKAGVMEVADVFVVNKADRGGAELLETEILAMQGLAAGRGGWTPPVVRTAAIRGEGVAELMVAVRQAFAAKRSVRATEVPRLPQTDIHIGGGLGTESLTLDHFGVAVRSIASARRFYELLGLAVSHEETVEHERVKTAMLPLGESRIELLEGTDESSTISRFLAKRGEGLHHVALRVNGIDALFARLLEQGTRIASDAVRVGAGGHRYFFVHPSSTGGVLLEMVEDSGLHKGED